MQVQWYVDADFSGELDRYEQETRKAAAENRLNRWGEVARVGRLERYQRLMEKRILRRQHLELYIVTKIPIPKTISQGHRTTSATEYRARNGDCAFELEADISWGFGCTDEERGPLPGVSAAFEPVVKAGFLGGKDRAALIEGFAPELSVQENCWKTDAMTVSENGSGS